MTPAGSLGKRAEDGALACRRSASKPRSNKTNEDRCSRACLHDIPVQKLQTVRHRDCTNCLECLDACPEREALQLRAEL